MTTNNIGIYLKVLAVGTTAFFLNSALISWLWFVVIDKPLDVESIRRNHAAVNILLKNQMSDALNTGNCNELASGLVGGLPGVRATIWSNNKLVCSSHASDTGWVDDANYPSIKISEHGRAELQHVSPPTFQQQVVNNLKTGFSVTPPKTYGTWRGKFITILSAFISVVIAVLFLTSRLKNQRLKKLNDDLSAKGSEVSSLYGQKETVANKYAIQQARANDLENELLGKLESEKRLKDELAEMVLNNPDAESLSNLVHDVVVSLKNSIQDRENISDDLEEALQGWESDDDEHKKAIDDLQENIDHLQNEVKSLQKETLEMISKQELREQLQQGIQELEKIKKLWTNKNLTWKERKSIEKEISQDSLPLSAFIAIVSIERYLRTMSGIDDDSQARRVEYIRGTNLDRRQEDRVWKAFHVRDKWFHGEKCPGSVRQYETIINLADEMKVKAISI